MRLSAAAVITGVATALVVAAVPGAPSGSAAAPGSGSARTTAAAQRPPAPRTPLTYEATPRGNRASEIVQWRNPRASSWRKIVVRYSRGSKAPTSPRRGHGVHLNSRRAHSVTLGKLARDTTYSVSIFAIGRGGRASRPAVARFTTPAVITPGPRGALHGTVTDTAGRPLVHADVTAYEFSTGRRVGTVTDATGAYVLGLPAGQWDAYASGATARGGNSDATGYAYDDVELTVAGGRTATRTFRLPAGGRLTGRVLDTAGRAVAGAQPYVISPLPYVTSGGVFFGLSIDGNDIRTDGSGRYVLRGVPAGEAGAPCATALAARVAGRVTDLVTGCAQRTVAVGAGRSAALPDLRLARGPGGVLTGLLRGVNGRPLVGGITVKSVKDDTFVAYGRADGRSYRIPGVASGKYRVCAAAESAAGSRTGWTPGCATTTVRVRGTATVRSDVTLRRGAAVSGTVTGPGGRRLAGATVSLSRPGEDPEDSDFGSVRTDSRGQWRATGLPSGSYIACADGFGVTTPATGAAARCWRHKAAVTVRAKRVRSGIDFRLPAAGGVTGTVVTTAGAPVSGAGVTVQLLGDSEGDDPYFDFVTADAQGRFTAGGYATGRYRVCAERVSDDFASGRSDATMTCTAAFTIRTGQVTRGARIVLPPPTAISVEVRDASGEPVSTVNVAALSRCRGGDCLRTSLLPGTGVDLASSTMTGGDGRATLTVGKAGSYGVCLFAFFATTVSGGSPTGYADRCHGSGFDVAVTAGRTTSVSVTLAAGGSVSGRLVDPAGHGVADGRVVVPGAAADDTPGYPADEGDGDEGDGVGYGDFGDDVGYGAYFPTFPTPFAGSRTGPDGRFSIIGVRPGTWTVCAHDARGAGRFATSCSGGPSSPGVTVTAGLDTRADIATTKPR